MTGESYAIFLAIKSATTADQKEEEILEPEPAQEIPDWIKNTAQWWSEDLISEKEFIQVVEYLIKTGLIEI